MAQEATESKLSWTIGRYDVVGHLASGGMAEIVLGRMLGPSGFQRPVVIKRILPHLAREQAFVEMFLDEARIVAGIRHPNVVNVHELGHEAGELFLVMEYLEGESAAGLTRRLRVNTETLSHALSAYVVAEACAGLHAAHELSDADGVKQNVVHRDISPQNVFVTYDGQVKVLDFGIATAADRITKTEAGQFKGKFEYSSPEQCRGLPLDRRSDVFALGILLYELSTGTRLFKRAGQLDTLRAICEQPVIPPSESAHGYPEVLSAIMMKALAKKPKDRYATALEMRRDLLAALRTIHPAGSPDEELGGVMQRLFGDRIAEKKEMLRRVQAGTNIGEIPSVETDASVEIPIAYAESLSDPPVTIVPVSNPNKTNPNKTNPNKTNPNRTGSRSVPTDLANDASSEEPPMGAFAGPISKPRLTLVLVGSGVLALIGIIAGVAAIASPRRGGAVASSSAQPSASASAALAPAPAPASAAPEPSAVVAPAAPVVLRVETSPAKAHVFVGGTDRGLSPLDVRIDRGTEAVVLEIKRDGYQTLSEPVVPDVDQRLRLTLVPTTPAVGAAAPPPKPSASAKGAPYHRFD
jgi:serine/threonine-protein kinase